MLAETSMMLDRNIKGGKDLSEPVTYDGVKNLIHEAVKEIAKSNDKLIEKIEESCAEKILFGEKSCLAKSFLTENVKEKFYKNIRDVEKAHERIDIHLLWHKNTGVLMKWLITIIAGSGWGFALTKYIFMLLSAPASK